MFNVSCLYSDSQNYTLDWENYYVNVTESEDITLPYFTGISLNTTLEFLTDSLSIGFNATDETEFDSWQINNTINFLVFVNAYFPEYSKSFILTFQVLADANPFAAEIRMLI